jgi:hypothetical protein
VLCCTIPCGSSSLRQTQSVSIIKSFHHRRYCGLENWSNYIEPKVGVSIIATFHSSHCMPDPSTPPNSQGIDSGTILSDTTPLRRDIPGSEIHTSTPPRRASERYADMTFDNCDRFVGPMPVQDFLDEFLPSTEAPASRPKGNFPFCKPSVSRNEIEFVSPFTINVHTMKLTAALY